MNRILIPFALAAAAVPGIAVADTPERVHAFFVQWDLNHDDKISLEEFRVQAAKSPEPFLAMLTPDLVLDTFKSYDLDGDGFITEAEMQDVNRRANATASDIRKN